MARFGNADLPDEQRDALRRAKVVEWLSIGYTACTVTAVAFVVGNSQAMRTAWIEDMLSVLPQVAFLVAMIFIRRPPTRKHPYGMHRTMGIGHVVGGVALLIVGGTLGYEAVSGLVLVEHPTIGTVAPFGHTLWLGWLMVAVMVLIAIPPFFFIRVKKELAETLNNKLLHADAAMAHADWQTNAASIVGVLGIGIGLWWLDGVAAAFIAAGIIKDGWDNTRASVLDLMDMRATTVDQRHPDPLIDEIEELVADEPWARQVACRARDLGNVLHVEVFVIPREGSPSLDEIEATGHAVAELSWRLQDVVVTPVSHLPAEFEPDSSGTARA